MKYAIWFYIISVLTFSAFAQDAAQPMALPDVPINDWLKQSMTMIQEFGGVNWIGKISIIMTLVTSSMKVSFLNQMIWSKIKHFQVWVAPLLAVGYCFSLKATEGKFPSMPELIAYFSAGAGAIILHEMLDSAKQIPWLGERWLSIIIMIESALGKQEAQQPAIGADPTEKS